MSDEKKIEEKDLNKALSTLQELAKGHSSRGTNTTKVEAMSSEGGSPQVHHTASNSDPDGWAGSKARDCAENGATDAIDENGTDYNSGAEMVKSIQEKLSKGQQLTPEEYQFVVEKGMPAFLKKDDDKNGDDKDKKDDVKKAKDDDDDDVKKSLADEAAANETVNNGMEISEFLAEFVGTFNKSLSNMESRITERLLNAVSEEATRNETFNKSLAGAVGTLGEGLVAQVQRVDQVENTPARGPKSQEVVDSVSKSFTGPDGEGLSKAVVAATLVDMVENGKIDAHEVIKFDSCQGQISDVTMAKVVAHRAGK